MKKKNEKRKPGTRYNTNSVEDRVARLLAATCALDLEEITSDADLVNDLGMDSLDHVELAMCIEEEFNLPEFDDEEFENLKLFSDLVRLVERQVALNQPTSTM